MIKPILMITTIIFLFQGCHKSVKSTQHDLGDVLHAYDMVWHQDDECEDVTKRMIFSPHGLFGTVTYSKCKDMLITKEGVRVWVRDSIYALQSNGTYVKYKASPYSFSAMVNDWDNKLTVMIDITDYSITDCKISPPNEKRDLNHPLELQIFGELDLKNHRFLMDKYVNKYDEGDRINYFKEHGIQSEYRFLFEHSRKMCEP